MSEKQKKPTFDPATAKTIDISEIPEKATKAIWQNWIPILQNLIKTPTKALTVNEKEGSIGAIRNQIAKAINTAKIEGIIVNTRNVNKLRTLYISYKKPIVKK
jgi:hypothetical protein